MADGPGKYNELCAAARQGAAAAGAILIIIGGRDGHGFSVQAQEDVARLLPDLLRHLAATLEKELRAHDPR